MPKTETGHNPTAIVRQVASIWAWLFTAFFAWITFTVPMIMATAPAIIAVVCGVVAFFLWPRENVATG